MSAADESILILASAGGLVTQTIVLIGPLEGGPSKLRLGGDVHRSEKLPKASISSQSRIDGDLAKRIFV